MSETMSSDRTCPKCGAPLADDTAEGLCPACLLALNLATQTELTEDIGPNGTQKVPPPPKSPPNPQDIAGQFPQFEILDCLGRGGMGVVYKARQKSLDRLVALKILAPEREKDPQFAERFAREAKTLAQLSHPSIVTVHDFGEAGGMFYLVMEFVDGVNLRQLLKERKLSPEEALAIVPPVCEALQYAHKQGVIHRDIKPENLLLDKQGRIKIADFGIAKILGRAGSPPPAASTSGIPSGAHGATLPAADGDELSSVTQDQVIGTPQYMAPEQTTSPQKVDHRADIYSLGVVLYEMLTGELPTSNLRPPSRTVQVDVRIDEIVLRALEKEPARRYQTATQFKTMVETISAGTEATEGGTRKAESDQHKSIASVVNARNQLKAPAIGLIATGGIQIAVFLVLLVLTLPATFHEGGGPASLIIGGMAALSLLAAALIISGAIGMLRLRHHTLAVIASVVAMIGGPAAILGLPFGVWSLVVLNRREVREAFDAGGTTNNAVAEERRGASSPSAAVPQPEQHAAGVSARGCFFMTGTAVLVSVALMFLLAVGSIVLAMFLPAYHRARTQAAPKYSDASEPLHDFVVFHPATNGTAALDAARDFLFEHNWKHVSADGVSADGDSERVTISALDANGKRVTFEEALQAEGMARFTVSAEPGAELTARRIGSELWHRLGWGDLNPTREFGPVIERLLIQKRNGELSLIDFDENRTPPDPEIGSWDDFFPWAASHGIDASVTDTDLGKGEIQGLVGWDMRLLVVDSNVWDDITPATLALTLKSISQRQTVSMWPKNILPATYLFQTREGGKGVLQITAFSDEPHGLKLRYKLTHEPASSAPGGTEAAVLKIKLQAAQAKLAELEKKREAGVVSTEETDRARTEVEVLQAQLAGDSSRVAAIRLEGARRQFELASQRFAAGVIPRAELEAASAEMKIRELEAQSTASSAPVASDDPGTARIQLMQSEPGRQYWRWRVFRKPGFRMVYGVLDVTDPSHPKQLLMGMEHDPLTTESSQDYSLRLLRQPDKWRVEIESAWAGESGGRGATWEEIDAPPGATMQAILHEQTGELNASRYHVFWLGDLALDGRVIKRLRFVARLAETDDPIQNILDQTDPVRTFDVDPNFHGALTNTVRAGWPGSGIGSMPWVLLLLLSLLGVMVVAVVLGGAVWWITVGIKAGIAQARIALVLAIGGPLFATVMGLIASRFGIFWSVTLIPAFLACEIPAFCLGVLSRRTALGKAAMIISTTLVLVSVSFLIIPNLI